MVPVIFTAASLLTFSNAILNSKQSIASPCQSAFLTLMGSGLAFFISSACIRSIPGALWSLSFCMAFSTSSYVGVGSSTSEYTW